MSEQEQDVNRFTIIMIAIAVAGIFFFVNFKESLYPDQTKRVHQERAASEQAFKR
jgi:hypothetical protein